MDYSVYDAGASYGVRTESGGEENLSKASSKESISKDLRTSTTDLQSVSSTRPQTPTTPTPSPSLPSDVSCPGNSVSQQPVQKLN